jgi:hypothetical protein
MTAFVIAKEGPIFADLLITRIARAHGFGRSGGKIREIIRAAIDPGFSTSKQDELVVLWPEGMEPKSVVEFRFASLEVRGLNDIPEVELLGLIKETHQEWSTPDGAVANLAAALGVGRLTDGVRRRLSSLIEKQFTAS